MYYLYHIMSQMPESGYFPTVQFYKKHIFVIYMLRGISACNPDISTHPKTPETSGIGPDPRAGRRGVVRGLLISREWGERSEPTGHELNKKMIGMIIDLLPHPPACHHGAGATIPRPSDGLMSGRPDKLLHNIIWYTLPTSLWYRDRRNTAQLKTRQKYFKVVSHFFYKNGSV